MGIQRGQKLVDLLVVSNTVTSSWIHSAWSTFTGLCVWCCCFKTLLRCSSSIIIFYLQPIERWDHNALMVHSSCSWISPDGSKVTSCPLCGIHLLSLALIWGAGWGLGCVFHFESSRGVRMPCVFFTHIFGTDIGFFHSCNHVFVSFASSAQGKLLSWQHLSLRIIEAVTGEKGF